MKKGKIVMEYYRKSYKKILKHLNRKEITLITGPRQVGKTTIMKQLQAELKSNAYITYFITLENKTLLELLNVNPENIFQVIPAVSKEERIYIFIDEIQYLDDPSNFLKLLYDLYNEKIKFIVSGSSSFYIDSKFKDSMAGRKRLFELMTLSFDEMLIFQNRAEFVPYLNTGEKIPLICRQEIYNCLYEYLLFGGYPEVVLESDVQEKIILIKEIADSYVKKDAIEAKIKYPDAYFEIMKILAGQAGALFNSHTLAKTLKMSNNAVLSYTRLMRKSYYISFVRPFYNNIPKELTKMPKVYFNDLGLRNYFLGNFTPIGIREDKGELFESFAFRRLADFYSMDDIKYWRTQKKQEVDFIIPSKKQAYEAKFSESQFNKSKYRYFKNSYPDISLSLLSMENILEVGMK